MLLSCDGTFNNLKHILNELLTAAVNIQVVSLWVCRHMCVTQTYDIISLLRVSS